MMVKRKKELTSSLPLHFIHLTLPILIDYLHTFHQRSELGVFTELCKYVVKLFAVFHFEAVFRCQSEGLLDY